MNYNTRYYQANAERLKARQRERYYQKRDKLLAQFKAERADPAHPRRGRERNQKITATFGITQVEYLELLMAQGGVCKICNKDPGYGRDGRTKLQIDHDHKTGQVRGILCPSCNSGLAKFNEDPRLLAAAIEYLQ